MSKTIDEILTELLQHYDPRDHGADYAESEAKAALQTALLQCVGEDEPDIVNTTPGMKTGRYNFGGSERNKLRAEIRQNIKELFK